MSGMNDYKQALFDLWAPPGSPWSAWAKPVLFTQAGMCPGAVHWSASAYHEGGAFAKLVRAPGVRASGASRQAIVVDLPALDTMCAAAQLAQSGYRPVPLFNTTRGPKPLVRVDDILDGFLSVGNVIESAGPGDLAPPVFLLDSHRQPGNVSREIDAGKFDNRWLVFPQDFPSAEFLKEHGIDSVLLCQANLTQPADDLAHVLLRWQEAGLRISCAWADGENFSGPQPLTVRTPPGYRSWMRRLLVLLKLRRSSAGGFGGIIPEAGSGGGGRFG
jgi:hypothetical protein